MEYDKTTAGIPLRALNSHKPGFITVFFLFFHVKLGI